MCFFVNLEGVFLHTNHKSFRIKKTLIKSFVMDDDYKRCGSVDFYCAADDSFDLLLTGFIPAFVFLFRYGITETRSNFDVFTDSFLYSYQIFILLLRLIPKFSHLRSLISLYTTQFSLFGIYAGYLDVVSRASSLATHTKQNSLPFSLWQMHIAPSKF